MIVVLSHLGYTDGGYGYGIPVYGDQTLAAKLNTAGKPANLIIGGHSHTDTSATARPWSATTTVAQAYYNGRKVGRADITVRSGHRRCDHRLEEQSPSTPMGPRPDVRRTSIDDLRQRSALPGPRSTRRSVTRRSTCRRLGNGDNMMGDFVDDAIYNYLNNDADPANDVDLFFNNAGGIRTDWCDKDPRTRASTLEQHPLTARPASGHDPMLLNYGRCSQSCRSATPPSSAR